MDQSLTWLEILKVGGLAGIVSALFATLLKESFEAQRRNRQARSMALKLAHGLEDYYRLCRDKIYDIKNYQSSRGNAGENFVGLPEMAAYPQDDVAWTYLPHSLADSLLKLPRVVHALREGVIYNLDMDYDPEGPDPAYSLSPLYEVALRSADLASQIRRELRLPPNLDIKISELRTDQADFEQRLARKNRSDSDEI